MDGRTNTPVDGYAWTRHGSYTPIPVSPNYHNDRGRSSRDGGRFLIPRLRCSTGVSINSRVYARLLSFYDPPSFQPVDRPNLSDRPPSRLDCPHSWLSQSGSSLETRRRRIPREASRCYAAQLSSVIEFIFERLREPSRPSSIDFRRFPFWMFARYSFQNWILRTSSY